MEVLCSTILELSGHWAKITIQVLFHFGRNGNTKFQVIIKLMPNVENCHTNLTNWEPCKRKPSFNIFSFFPYFIIPPILYIIFSSSLMSKWPEIQFWTMAIPYNFIQIIALFIDPCFNDFLTFYIPSTMNYNKLFSALPRLY